MNKTMEQTENNLTKNERIHGLTAIIAIIAIVLWLGLAIAIIVRSLIN